MRIPRNYLWGAVALLLIAGGVLTAILLRMRAAPDVVRLLPECDAVLYVNLAPIRLLTDLKKTTPKERDPQYQAFIQETGFEFERDLDKAAFAVHYGAAKKGNTAETRYSEILQGHFDNTRVSTYLRKLSTHTEPYQGYEIYVIPVEDRTVRVVLLGVDIAAISNLETSDTIHGMVDRYRGAALPFSGPSLVRSAARRAALAIAVAACPTRASIPFC